MTDRKQDPAEQLRFAMIRSLKEAGMADDVENMKREELIARAAEMATDTIGPDVEPEVIERAVTDTMCVMAGQETAQGREGRHIQDQPDMAKAFPDDHDYGLK